MDDFSKYHAGSCRKYLFISYYIFQNKFAKYSAVDDSDIQDALLKEKFSDVFCYIFLDIRSVISLVTILLLIEEHPGILMIYCKK